MSFSTLRSDLTGGAWQNRPWGLFAWLIVGTLFLAALRPAPIQRWVETWQDAAWREPVRLAIEDYQRTSLGNLLGTIDHQAGGVVEGSVGQVHQFFPSAHAAASSSSRLPGAAPAFVVPADIVVTRPTRVLFVGDSMMQGLGMFLSRRLQKNFQARPVDVSKTSTGLTNRNYYDWPEHFREFLTQHQPELVVVMLGANDRLDMIDHSDGRKFLRFNSPGWQAAYAARVRDMNQAARAAGATVIWVGLPAMREAQFDDAARATAPIIEAEARAANMLYLASRPLLSDDEGNYSHYLQDGERKVLARASDGVHFAPYGANRLSEAVMKVLEARYSAQALLARQ